MKLLLNIAVCLCFIASASFAQSQPSSNSLAQHLTEFAKTSAVTGREGEAANYIQQLLAGSSIKKDGMGNLFMVIGSGSPKRLFTTPLDEPGYVVSHIQDNGYLKLSPIGYGHTGPLFHQFLEGHEVTIGSESGPKTAICTVPSTHYDGLRVVRESSKAPFQWQEAFIDVGASSAEEVASMGIQLLDPIALNKKPMALANNTLAAPSMKSKSAAIALAAVAHHLADAKVNGTIVIAWTTLELINSKGFETIVNQYGPFDEIYRFNRFLESTAVNQKVLLSDADQNLTGTTFDVVKPTSNFRSSASTLNLEASKVSSVGMPSLHTNTPVETVALDDVNNLINFWLSKAGISTPSKVLPASIPKNQAANKSFTTHAEEALLVSQFVDRYGVSTAEKPVRDFILSQLPSWTKPKVDAKGNIVLTFGQGADHVVFVAHMDETGFLVDSIRADGKLVLTGKGGFFDWLWEAQPAIIHAAETEIPAIFEPREGYLTATTRAIEKEPVVDAGFASKEAALNAGIEVGKTTVTMPKAMIRLSEHRAAARAFDDRVGCASLLLALKRLDLNSVIKKVTVVFSVEEEVGLNGAAFAAKSLKDASIVYPIDTFVSSDDPQEPHTFGYCPLGEGAVIRVLESINYVSRNDLNYVQKLAKNNQIKTQVGMTAGGTDGQPFVGYGIRSVPLSWPGRYSHSPVEIMDFRDMDSLIRLINALMVDNERTYD